MRIEKFLDASPLFNLAVAYAEILGDFERSLAAEGVHFLQALILTGLFFEGKPVRPTVLAQTFRVAKSNMSHALRDLERKDLVERSSVALDARAYDFTLSRSGRRMVPRLIKIFDATQDLIESAPEGQKINPTLKLFRQIHRNLG